MNLNDSAEVKIRVFLASLPRRITKIRRIFVQIRICVFDDLQRLSSHLQAGMAFARIPYSWSLFSDCRLLTNNKVNKYVNSVKTKICRPVSLGLRPVNTQFGLSSDISNS